MLAQIVIDLLLSYCLFAPTSIVFLLAFEDAQVFWSIFTRTAKAFLHLLLGYLYFSTTWIFTDLKHSSLYFHVFVVVYCRPPRFAVKFFNVLHEFSHHLPKLTWFSKLIMLAPTSLNFVLSSELSKLPFALKRFFVFYSCPTTPVCTGLMDLHGLSLRASQIFGTSHGCIFKFRPPWAFCDSYWW